MTVVAPSSDSEGECGVLMNDGQVCRGSGSAAVGAAPDRKAKVDGHAEETRLRARGWLHTNSETDVNKSQEQWSKPGDAQMKLSRHRSCRQDS